RALLLLDPPPHRGERAGAAVVTFQRLDDGETRLATVVGLHRRLGDHRLRPLHRGERLRLRLGVLVGRQRRPAGRRRRRGGLVGTTPGLEIGLAAEFLVALAARLLLDPALLGLLALAMQANEFVALADRLFLGALAILVLAQPGAG